MLDKLTQQYKKDPKIGTKLKLKRFQPDIEYLNKFKSYKLISSKQKQIIEDAFSILH